MIAKTSCRQNLHIYTRLESLAYSQALRIKRIYSKIEKYQKPSEDLLKWFVQKGYKEVNIHNQITRVDNLGKSSLL